MISRHPWGGLADPAIQDPADVVILGLPYEGGFCWRGGAAGAPGRLREISASSPAISETGSFVDPATFRVFDAGDITPDPAGVTTDDDRRRYFAQVENAAAEIFRMGALAGRNAFLLSLGGDHSVNIPLMSAFAHHYSESFGLVSLDAHPDLFDIYDGSSISAGCPLRRALDSNRLAADKLLILGTRSYNKVELDFMNEKGIRFVPAREIERHGVDAVVALARERMGGTGNVYLTIDIDVADPACAPGTGAPVAGGLSSRQVLDLTRGLLESLPVRAMDLVEVSPDLDPTDATIFLALQMIFESFDVLARKRRPSE